MSWIFYKQKAMISNWFDYIGNQSPDIYNNTGLVLKMVKCRQSCLNPVPWTHQNSID